MLLAMTIPAVDRMAIVAGRDPLEGRMLVLDHLVGAGGRPRIGALAALADSIAGVHAFEITTGAVPLTADLAVHLVGRPVAPGAELSASSEVLKRRRTGAVFGVEVHERRSGELVATSTVTYTLVEGLPDYVPEPYVGDWPAADLSSSMADVLPLRAGEEGDVLLEIDDMTRNAVGVLSGGTILMAADVAAAHAAERASGTPVEVTDLLVHFLAPGRSGPARYRTGCWVQGLVGLARSRVEEAGPAAGSGPISTSTARFRLVEADR